MDIKLTRNDVAELIERGLKVYHYPSGNRRHYFFLTDHVRSLDDAVYVGQKPMKGAQPLPRRKRAACPRRKAA